MTLSARGLTLALGGRAVVSDIDLVLPRGRFVGLVGPNGAGKTTLLRALAALLKPLGGSVTLDGRALSGLARDERARRVAVLFQAPGPGWPMPVREVVALGRLPHRGPFAQRSEADRRAVDAALVRAGVAHLAGRAISALSAGERARVLLARALAVEAEWLLADEPITALDPAHQLDVMELLRDEARSGSGVVAVLHDLSLAARFCDRIVVLDEGRIAADAAPDGALTDAILGQVFAIDTQRGRAPDGVAYLLPWARIAPRG